MRIWLLRASELLPVVDATDRLLRMGMLASELSKNNHDITWFASTFNHFKKKQYANSDIEIQVSDNYKLNLIHAISYKKNISIKRIINHRVLAFKLKYKMKKLEKPDIIYASFPTIEFAYEAVLYGKKNNIPVVIDIRDLWPDIFNHNLKGLLKIMAIPYIKYLNSKTKKIMKECYAITSISEGMLEWGLKKGNRTKSNLDRCFYIGYKKEEVKDISSIKKEFSSLFQKDKFNICFFATINNQFDYKKIHEIALKLEPHNIQILVCGTGPNLESFKAEVKDTKNIKFLGWQDKNSLDYILKNSQIGFAPYKNTFDFQLSVSNKFSEYLSYSLPVVLTSTGYMKDLAIKNQVGFASTDSNEICDFIISLKNDTKKLKKYSTNAMKLFMENFDASKIYVELVKYLEKIEKEYKK